MRRLLLALLLLASMFVAPAAAATFEDAQRAEELLAFAQALRLYEETVRLDPSNVLAEQRAIYLRARSEGDFAPLATLEDARRRPDPEVHGLLVTAESFPPGLVRVEAWVFIADHHARSGHPEDAVPLWRRAARDEKADPALARRAIRSAVDVHLANGEVAAADADLAWYGDPEIAKVVRRAARRRHLHHASIVIVALALGGAVWGVARSRRRAVVLARLRGSARLVLAYALYVAGAGALLAAGYARGTSAPFLWLGAVLVPLLFAARAWGAAGGAPRGVRAVACAASVLGAAFLVLERTGHLDALGL